MPYPSLTPAESRALQALEIRRDWPRLTGRICGEEASIQLRRADGKTIEIRGERAAALIRAGGIAEEMAADARRREVVRT